MKIIICSVCGIEEIVPSHWHHNVCKHCHFQYHKNLNKKNQMKQGLLYTVLAFTTAITMTKINNEGLGIFMGAWCIIFSAFAIGKLITNE